MRFKIETTRRDFLEAIGTGATILAMGGVGVAWKGKEVDVDVEVWSDGVSIVVVGAKTPPAAVPPAAACSSSSAIKASSDKLAK